MTSDGLGPHNSTTRTATPPPATAPNPHVRYGPAMTTDASLPALPLRPIGPALMGGRIADLAIHPNTTTWYVAVGSGGVWKTTNAGTTWTAIFEQQPSYSIGCITLDPSDPQTVWVGTGEAVSGRHVAWGDGVYRSLDGGVTWEHMGLAASEHIAQIEIDPRDSDTIHVAAEGPLWSSGGERGLFTSRDGGVTWEQTLETDADTGVTSITLAPDDPDTLVAATFQRRRTVQSYMGGGPGSGIHTSTDGGRTWTQATVGLPAAHHHLGKIGLAVTPADPSIVYATIEAPEDDPADPKNKGCYRSSDRGRTWERRSGYISGGTGPHYYQELFASPVDPAKVYQVDVFLHVTTDGGTTFKPAETGKNKHADNHVVWIDPANPQHLLVGCDAGLYETFDDCATFRHMSNLPISQFYRVAVDDSLPFANILGGAQDLGTLAGPTRTMHVDGVRNQDWWVPLGADGYRTAFDPHDPDISYLEWQVGNIMRHDRRTMELTDIQPLGDAGDPPERFNWDTPILCSPHAKGRIYTASQRVWRSDDRGDSWTAISGDLTRDLSRLEMPTGDRVWSVDDLYDHMAMSFYSTITDLSESPVANGELWVGTDDGLVQHSSDGGATWTASGELPGLAERAFINDVEACLHRSGACFVAADDHKNGDDTPYLFETVDGGQAWRSIRGDLPDGVIVWQIEQDHIDPALLFVGAENGLYVSLDGGDHWHRMGQGDSPSMPTIGVRDLAIQRRDNDLVAATFGRGFYVLDDYSPLRGMSVEALAAPATMFPIRQAWRYVPHQRMQAEGQPTLGSTAFRTDNPPFGAVVTYHLAAAVETARAARLAAENDAEGNVAFPGFAALAEERLETAPVVQLVVRDADGAVVRRLDAPHTAGLHRVAWDLRRPAHDPVNLAKPEFVEPWVDDPVGPLCAAGTYTVELVRMLADGTAESLAGSESVEVLDVVTQADGDDGTAFGAEIDDLRRRIAGAAKAITAARDRLTHLRVALAAAPGSSPELVGRLDACHRSVEAVAAQLTGDPVLADLHEPPSQSVKGLADRAGHFHLSRTGAPTQTQRKAAARAATAFGPLRAALDTALEELAEITAAIDTAGGTWTPR